jgi:GNAT superfamily N-acetyltransferase
MQRSAAFSAIGWDKPASLFETYLAEYRDEQRVALVAEFDSTVAGYGTIVWDSPYEHFRARQIPEIKDLNVLPTFRRQGIATALMDALESAVAERSTQAAASRDPFATGWHTYDLLGGPSRTRRRGA